MILVYLLSEYHFVCVCVWIHFPIFNGFVHYKFTSCYRELSISITPLHINIILHLISFALIAFFLFFLLFFLFHVVAVGFFLRCDMYMHVQNILSFTHCFLLLLFFEKKKHFRSCLCGRWCRLLLLSLVINICTPHTTWGV